MFKPWCGACSTWHKKEESHLAEKERVDAYLATIERMEPDLAMVDAGAAYASIAISLKRLADSNDEILHLMKASFQQKGSL